MQAYPRLSCVKIEKAKPGELLIFPDGSQTSIGLKVIDPTQGSDDDPLTLVLGPTFSGDVVGPHIGSWFHDAALSFGADFLVELPADLNKWSFSQPDAKVPALVVAGDHIFVRANKASTPGRVAVCYVKISDGTIHENISRHRSYATSWEIKVPIADAEVSKRAFQSVLKF